MPNVSLTTFVRRVKLSTFLAFKSPDRGLRRSKDACRPLKGSCPSPLRGKVDRHRRRRDGWGAMIPTRARELRRNMTEAERRLWSAIRHRRLNRYKFRRQQQIGHYIVDFYCPEARLVIEVDGSQHSNEEQAWYDYRRSSWLKSKSYRILRFTNHDVLRHPVEVVEAIWEALVRPPIRPAVSAEAATAVHLRRRGGKGNS